MKTAEEKARKWLIENMPGNSDTHFNVKSLSKLLKEQDRDTRHQCAENIGSLSIPDNLIGRGVIVQAHSIIMNTKAV